MTCVAFKGWRCRTFWISIFGSKNRGNDKANPRKKHQARAFAAETEIRYYTETLKSDHLLNFLFLFIFDNMDTICPIYI